MDFRPERQPYETQAEYRSRQRANREAVKAMTAGVNERNPGKSTKKPSTRDIHRAKVRAMKPAAPQPKPLVQRKRKPKEPTQATWPVTLNQRAQSRPVHNLNPNRERDPLKREKPKSAVAKRMDRPERTALIDRGHVKLMRFFGA